MSDTILNKQDCFAGLCREWPDSLLPSIRNQIKENSRTKVVILDDDPTGTQTVHGLPVLTIWDVKSLQKELEGKDNAFFILTNSRGFTNNEAIRLAEEIGLNLKNASKAAGIKLVVISRSDSTLRGHFPGEVDAMAEAMGETSLPYLICPFFLEGGRFTINDIHYVEEDANLVPAAMTSYARDAAFGFRNSNLKSWVEEKTRGRILKKNVHSISFENIRKGGPEAVMKALMEVPDKGACIVNAVSYRDMEVFVTGLLGALKHKKQFLFRTAASFVRVFAGVEPKKNYLSKKDLVSENANGGLFMVGSYVPKTTAQVKVLLNQTDILPVSINVENLLDDAKRRQEIDKAVSTINNAIKEGRDTLLYTSRNLVTGNGPGESLRIGQSVSSSLVEIVRSIKHKPRYMVAKGGITSSDVATKGLDVKRAMIMGQALPGVPVWKLGGESRHPGMSYIIFPGNVGDDQALAHIQKKLKD